MAALGRKLGAERQSQEQTEEQSSDAVDGLEPAGKARGRRSAGRGFGVLSLQRTAGNKAVSALVNRPPADQKAAGPRWPAPPEVEPETERESGDDVREGHGGSPTLAHELADAVQQRRGLVGGPPPLGAVGAPPALQRVAAEAPLALQRVAAKAPTGPLQVQRAGKATTTTSELEEAEEELESLLGDSRSGIGGGSSFAKLRDAVASYNRAVGKGADAAKADNLLARVDELATQWVNSHHGDANKARRGAVVGLLERVAEARRSGTHAAALDQYMADLASGAKLQGDQGWYAESATPFTVISSAARAEGAERADRARFIDDKITTASVFKQFTEEKLREVVATTKAERLGLTPAEQAALRTYTHVDYTYMNPGMAGSRSWMVAKTKDPKLKLQLAKPKDGSFENTEGNKELHQLPTSGRDRWINHMIDEGAMHAAVAQQALAKLPPYTGATYRGETVTAQGVPKVGAEFKTSNLTSTTFILSRAEGFLKENITAERPVGLIWVYTGGGGADVHDFSAVPSEGEVLVPYGAKYSIKEVREVKYTGAMTGQASTAYSSMQSKVWSGDLKDAAKLYVVVAEYVGGGHHAPTTGAAAGAASASDAEEEKLQLHFIARAKARQLINAAKEVEPKVTGDIKRLAKSRGGRVAGLQYRFKTEESLARKLEDRARTRVTAGDSVGMIQKAVNAEADKVNDSLRYTIIMPSSKYKKLADEVGKEMIGLGYKPGNAWNAWITSDTYKGHNLTFSATAEDGTTVLFELQLHTKDTFATKQEIHGMYEEARAAGTSPARRAELNKAMAEEWKKVKVPTGIINKPSSP